MGSPSCLQQNEYRVLMDQFLKDASFLNKALGYFQVKVSLRLEIDDADTNGLGFLHNARQLVGGMALHKQHSMVGPIARKNVYGLIVPAPFSVS